MNLNLSLAVISVVGIGAHMTSMRHMFKRRYIWIVGAGLSLALGLYLAIHLNTQRGDDALPDAPLTTDTTQKGAMYGYEPASFRQISEFMDQGVRRLRVSGQAEPETVVVITDRGERLRQIRVNDIGQWGLTLDIDDQPMVLEAQLFPQENSPGIRSEETIFRLPVPDGPDVADANFTSPALILVSSPGNPSRVIQSPFGGAPTNGPLTLGAIDYDDAGGIIVSGVSSVPGRIRLYAENNVIGETGIGVGGRWNYIAGKMLPRGEWDIRAELVPAQGSDAEPVSVSVPFALLPPLAASGDESGALSVNFQPLRWQVRRTLIGGGGQSTVIYAPSGAD